MPSNLNLIKRAVALPLEGFNIAVKIDYKAIPTLLPTTRFLNEERLNLQMSSIGSEYDSTLSLNYYRTTLVKSEKVSSMCQLQPEKK